MEDIEDILLEIEQEIHDGKKAFFGSGVTVNADTMLSAVDRIRRALPDMVREARQIIVANERKRQEDAARSQSIIAAAQSKADLLLSDHEIIKQAETEAEAIRRQALDFQSRLEKDVKSDISVLLGGAEKTLSEALAIIRNACDNYVGEK
ncbi:MAG: hypothetical protein PHI19_07370 [Clostridia bacterium]|nr:hypothetical protein [Clostridia bacterium]